jgi:hypothetical protein
VRSQRAYTIGARVVWLRARARERLPWSGGYESARLAVLWECCYFPYEFLENSL